MERHRCKLCFRNFANGRALGGHMRSHMMSLYASKKRPQGHVEDDENQEQLFDDEFRSVHSYSSTSAPSSSSSSEEDEDEQVEEENDEKESFLRQEKIVQDRESETESSKNNPVRRRSNRVVRKCRSPGSDRFLSVKDCVRVKKQKLEWDTEPVSSISETSPEEDVAQCLIMLSRDTWQREGAEEEEGVQEEKRVDHEEGSVAKGGVVKCSNKVRGKYRCETCSKLFKSYQALGGHRASHKKVVKVNVNGEEGVETGSGGGGVVEEKVHECPFCHRVFPSGQALGGHKRSHFMGTGGISGNGVIIKNDVNDRSNVKMEKVLSLNIDLNLPAPIDEDEEVAVSAVSDAEFVHPMKR